MDNNTTVFIENDIEKRLDDDYRQDWIRKMASVSEATATIDWMGEVC